MGHLEDDKRSRNLDVAVEEVVAGCTLSFGVVEVEDEGYTLEVIRE
jgi:hypothetical protein